MIKILVLAITMLFAALVVKINFSGTAQQWLAKNRDTHNTHVTQANRDLIVDSSDASTSTPVVEKMPSPPTEVEASPRLRIGWNPNPPRKYFDAKGQPQGLLLGVIKQAARRLHFALELRQCILAECLSLIQKQELDGVVEAMRTPERDLFLEYLNPQMPVNVARTFYLRANDGRDFASIGDLAGLTLGVIKGQAQANELSGASLKAKREFAGLGSMVEALQAQQIDAFSGPADAIDFMLNEKMPEVKLKKASLAFRETILVHFLALAKNSPLISSKARIEEVLEQMLVTGEVATIVDKERSGFARF